MVFKASNKCSGNQENITQRLLDKDRIKLTLVVYPSFLNAKAGLYERLHLNAISPWTQWKPEYPHLLEIIYHTSKYSIVTQLSSLLWNYIFYHKKLQLSLCPQLEYQVNCKLVTHSKDRLLQLVETMLVLLRGTHFKALEKRVSGSLERVLCWISSTSSGMCSTSAGRTWMWLCPTISFRRLRLLRILRRNNRKKQKLT